MAENYYISRETYQKLVAELDHLKKVRRPAASQAISEAREHGDISENAEYDAAKEELAHLQRRIAVIEEKLSRARFLEEQNIPSDRVYIGATVTLKDTSTNEEFSYTLVDPEEADPTNGKISVHSPVSQALLGKSPGEMVHIALGAQKYAYQILKITR